MAKKKTRVIPKDDSESARIDELNEELKHIVPDEDRKRFLQRMHQLENAVFEDEDIYGKDGRFIKTVKKNTLPYRKLQQKFISELAKYHVQEMPKVVDVKKPVTFNINVQDPDEIPSE